MNCKQGDLAMIVRSPDFPDNLGKLVHVMRRANADDFHVDPDGLCGQWACQPLSPLWGWTAGRTPVLDMAGIALDDDRLRPIRDPGEDAVDETLRQHPAMV